jgi:chemotaxis protein methyltransferase CheR
VKEIGATDIRRIVEAIYMSQGIDFSNYAFSSFKRRITRFLELNFILDINEFVEKIKTDNSFGKKLVKEIMVNVTEMFRDPGFWTAIRERVIPRLDAKKSINIWHAACSTGEEVYSMTILLKEAGLLGKSRIFATDIDRSVLDVAEKRIYSLKNQRINQWNYLQSGGMCQLSDYYTKDENTVRFNDELAERVEFRCHNLVSDEYISPSDLIICRNVFIYFNHQLQEKVINNFARSMATGSFLGIGSKESISWNKASRFFAVESHEEKIYRKVSEKGFRTLPYTLMPEDKIVSHTDSLKYTEYV